MEALTGWRIERRRDPIEFEFFGPRGASVAVATPSEPAWDPLWKVLRLSDRLAESEAGAWRSSGGVPKHRRVDVRLTDGTTFTTRNGAPKGPRRKASNAFATVRRRRYELRHTTGDSAEVWRDSVRVLSAWNGPGPVDSFRTGFGYSAAVRADAPLDETDSLMVVLFLDLFGPVGRSGAVTATLLGIKDEFLNP